MVSKKDQSDIADTLHRQLIVSNAIGRETVMRVSLALADLMERSVGESFDYDGFVQQVQRGSAEVRRTVVAAFEVEIDDRDLEVVHTDLRDAVNRIAPVVGDYGMRPLTLPESA